MKQFSSDTYTVAWFSLAECVARREKERALGLLRLLSHSFDDQALAFQLEGDVLYAFNDVLAEKKYVQAAALYKNQGKMVHAISLYELLVLLNPGNLEYRHHVLACANEPQHQPTILTHGTFLCRQYTRNHNYEAGLEIISTIQPPYCDEYIAAAEELVIGCMAANITTETVQNLMCTLIDHWVQQGDTRAVTRFTSYVENTQPTLVKLITKKVTKENP